MKVRNDNGTVSMNYVRSVICERITLFRRITLFTKTHLAVTVKND